MNSKSFEKKQDFKSICSNKFNKKNYPRNSHKATFELTFEFFQLPEVVKGGCFDDDGNILFALNKEIEAFQCNIETQKNLICTFFTYTESLFKQSAE